MTQRLDQALVAAGLADSRSRAQALIAAGVVLVDGVQAKKPSQKVGEVALSLTENPIPWVSRAALKLDHALREFDLSPKGVVALDVGASTGGFTEVLLANGAVRVYALDVGHGQLHARLRGDARVVNIEGVNARNIPDGLIPPVDSPLDWIVTDVSFISLTKALPQALALARQGAVLIALIKPQFEVGRALVGKGGIVKDGAAQEDSRRAIEAFLRAEGWRVTHRGESPVTGFDGNREFLVAATKI